MKKHKLLMVLTALVMGSAIFVSSCKDDGDEDVLGLIGSWKVTDATFNPPIDTGSGTPDFTDAYSMLFRDVCDQDDFFIFEANNVFKEDEGAVKCDAGDPQQDVGTYTHTGSTLSLITSDTSGGT